MDFSHLRGVVMDVDGVLWAGDSALPGADRFIAFLQARGIPCALATNNSNKSPADYQAKLAALGIAQLEERMIVTSGRASAMYLAHHYPAGTPVHVLGGDGLRLLVQQAGMTLTDALPCRVVIVGIDFTLSYDKLRRADSLLRQGADFIGTNADASFPMSDGPAPGAGSILALLRTSTGREPVVIGKPSRAMYEAALEITGTPAAHTLMVGDRLDTDIAGAQALGMPGALVLTGVTTRAAADRDAVQADGIFDTLDALIAAWKAQG